MIKFNETILHKAQDILEEKRKLEDYISTCLKANICPLCGGQLTKKHTSYEVTFVCTPCNNTFVT